MRENAINIHILAVVFFILCKVSVFLVSPQINIANNGMCWHFVHLVVHWIHGVP